MLYIAKKERKSVEHTEAYAGETGVKQNSRGIRLEWREVGISL